MKTNTKILIKALRKIPDAIHDEEGIVSSTILEAADRLEELDGNLDVSLEIIEGYKRMIDKLEK